MLIEIHMIQNHSPSNLNRDDLGAPKTCVFGGVTRARISSQCLKRSIRNPGNPNDVHNREPSVFAQALAGYIGTKTKLFPWLVKQVLTSSQIPKEEHRRIVLAAQRIAASKEKEEKRSPGSPTSDPRPKTAQLIHLGPGHAGFFVQKLGELRESQKECYQYFLNPIVGFQEMVRENLAGSGLDENDQDRVVNASWVIAKCRMKKLLEAQDGEEEEPEPKMEDGQPGVAHASSVAKRLINVRAADEKRFKALTKTAAKEEKSQMQEDAPDKPEGEAMKHFMEAIKRANRHDAVDIALFGRMTTSPAFQDVEAAMQVAHAISTHAVVNEVDYFTAVDDLGEAGGGAAHVDEAIFNSACFYKYFCLDWDQFVHNLAGPEPDEKTGAEAHSKWKNEVKLQAERLAACALGHFLLAAASTVPSGKQNSFAHNNEPCGILVEIKKSKTPTNYANAFAEPVERVGKPEDDAPDDKSIEGRSVACLADHVQSVRKAYETDSTLLWYSHKLWRFPFQYWKRSADGKKAEAKLVTEQRFDVLGGGYDKKNEATGMVAAVVKKVTGLRWDDVCDAGKASPKES